ncbi:lactate utilization protein [Anaerospora sp.]|jgi:hypothetical protein|uniref:lactate utilization protein n=1 Tax=Anaerospora sp. TaxID=1960278 RepID=UPI00289A4DB9|nr:lactate utilization protein [Anaerospora sp.]
MHEFKPWHNAVIGEKVVAALNKNNFKAVYVPTKEEAIEQILAHIPTDASVGIAGSWTIHQLGLDDLVETRGNTVYNHNKPGLSPETILDFRHKQLSCDVFLTSTNALTLNGKLVNTDGAGNRVAAMIFGPKKVIIVTGINKIVADVTEAEKRIQLHAAPINNKRLARTNPCVQTGQCMDCMSPQRICNITTVLHKKPPVSDIHIFVIGEDLGF